MTHPVQSDPEQSGLVVELARDDVERKKFLKMAGKGIGSAAAASGLAAFIAACGSSSTTSSSTPASTPSASPTTTTAASVPAEFGAGDLGIVNYALTLEYLESQFYAKVVASSLFSGSTLATLKTFGEEEAAHVAALLAVAKELGTPAAKPTGRFTVTNATDVAKLASVVENLGAAAYLGQAPYIKDAKILAAALAIHTVEARHAATLNTVIGLSPTPNGAFGVPATSATVLAAVKPFIA